MKSIKVRKKGTFYVFLLVKFIVFGLIPSCTSDEVRVNEGVADDGTPLGPGTELSAGLEEDLDPDAQFVGMEPIKEEAEEETAAPPSEFLVKAYYLNVRQGPANTYPVVRVLRKDQVVKGSLTESGWIKISNEEFVSSKYLKSK
ncbi:MAG: SH3 domain-containing protein [Oligoflexales bacterium]|nr:SH3 domain-containing protein [Oligoflexales bacterium]